MADITFSGDDFLNLSFAYLATDDSLSYDALERDTTFRHPYELLRYDEVQFGLQTVADYAEAMSTGLYPDDLSQTFEVLFPSLGGPAVDPATPLDQAEGMTTSLGDPPSIDDLLDALDRMDAQDQQDAADSELEIEQYLQDQLQMQLIEDIQRQDQIDIDLDFKSLIPELQGIVVLASKGPDRDVIVLAGE